MPYSSSGAERIANKEADEIAKGAREPLAGTDGSIGRHVLPLKYVCGPVFVLETPSDSFESAVLYVAYKVS